jgi:hypothetical protein
VKARPDRIRVFRSGGRWVAIASQDGSDLAPRGTGDSSIEALLDVIERVSSVEVDAAA